MKSKTSLFLAALLLVGNVYASEHYTLKLMSCIHKSTIDDFVSKHHLKNKTNYFVVNKINGKDWYVLTYGNYVSKAEADKALKTLPSYMKVLKPSVMIAHDNGKQISPLRRPDDSLASPFNKVELPRLVAKVPAKATELTLPGTIQEPTISRILDVHPSSDRSRSVTTGIDRSRTVTADQPLIFNLRPLFEAKGFGGNHAAFTGQLVMPITGNDTYSFFGILDGAYATSSECGWMGDLGLGYRKVKGERIYGGYLTVSGNSSPEHHKFWVANPGFETLGEVWDFRVNGYLTLSKRNWKITDQIVGTVPQSSIGDYSDVSFSVHNEFDRLVDLHAHLRESVHSGLGVDAEIGADIKKIPGLKFYLGGYHFNIDEVANITGGSARITYQINDYVGLEAIDTYDKERKNQALLGIKLTLGGFSQKEKDLFGVSGRLVDPIEHGIATRGYGNLVPVLEKPFITPERQDHISLIHDNLWFFVPNGSSNAGLVQGNGTYENPYIGLTLDNFNNINPSIGTIDKYPLLYFSNENQGNYHLDTFTNNRFTQLPTGWGMYGRDDHFKRPATGDTRPTFFGGINLSYGDNILNAFRVFNNTNVQSEGIYINGAQNIYFDNVQVGTLGNADGTAYTTALHINNGNQVVLDRSQIYGYHRGGEGILVNGIAIDSGNVILNQGNQIIAEKDDTGFNDIIAAEARGVYDLGGQLNVNNRNEIEAIIKNSNLVGTGIFSGMFSYGIYLNNTFLNLGTQNDIFATVSGGSIGGTGNASIALAAFGIYSNGGGVNINSDNSIYALASGRSIIPNQSPLGEVIAGIGIYQSSGDVYLNNGNNIRADAQAVDMSSAENIYDFFSNTVGAITININSGNIIVGNNNSLYANSYIGKRNLVYNNENDLILSGAISSRVIVLDNTSIAKFGDNNFLIAVLECNDFYADAKLAAKNTATISVDSNIEGISVAGTDPSLIIGNNNLISLDSTLGKMQLSNATGYTYVDIVNNFNAYGILLNQHSFLTMENGNIIAIDANLGSVIENGGLAVNAGSLLDGYGIYSNYTGNQASDVTLGSNNTIFGNLSTSSSSIAGEGAVNSVLQSEFDGIYRLVNLNLGSNNHFIGFVNNALATVSGTTIISTYFAQAAGINVIATGLIPSGSVTFAGGGNVFDLSAVDQNNVLGEAYGIFAASRGTVIFDESKIGSNKNIFNVGGNTGSWGVFAVSTASIQNQYGPISNLNELLNYNDFTRTGNGGYKIEWQGHGTIIW
jgi:hypothetical protein